MADGILGIDVGGTGIKAGLVDVEHGTIIGESREMPTPQPANVDALFEVIEELIQPWRGQYDLAGIAFPAMVRRGVVLSAVNVGDDWLYRDLGSHSRESLGTSVWTLNDCDAAAYAEMLYGAGRHEGGTIVMATLGTGVGTTLIVERQLVPNVELGMLAVRGKPAGQRVANSVRRLSLIHI